MKPLPLLIYALLAASSLASQTNEQKFYVSVTVTGDSKLNGDAESYLARELRSLGDVVVGTKHEEGYYELDIVVISIKTVQGVHTGIAMSYVLCLNQIHADRFKRISKTFTYT